jgi:hypothetical protein
VPKLSLTVIALKRGEQPFAMIWIEANTVVGNEIRHTVVSQAPTHRDLRAALLRVNLVRGQQVQTPV